MVHSQDPRIPELLDLVRESCTPATWSRGVELTRSGKFYEVSSDSDSLTVSVMTAVTPVSPRVTLSLADESWQCDCIADEDPCAHVAAAVIALKGDKIVAGGPVTRAGSGAIIYRFTRSGTQLRLTRHVRYEDHEEELTESLVSRVAGITSGRIRSAPVVATQEDFAIDAALGERGVRGLDPRQIGWILTPLSALHSVELDGHPIKVSRARMDARVVVEEEGSDLKIRVEYDPSPDELFEGGIARCGDQLYLLPDLRLSPEEAALLHPRGSRIPFKDAATLVSSTIPGLEAKLTVDIRTDRLPKAVRIVPNLAFTLRSLPGETLWVLPRIVYGDPPVAEVHPTRDNDLEVFNRGTVPIRDRTEEQLLVRELLVSLKMKPGIPVQVQGSDAVVLRRKLEDYHLTGDNALDFTAESTLTPRLELDTKEFRCIFEDPAAPGRFVSSEAVLSAWRSQQSFIALPGGGWGVLPKDWLARYGAQIEALLAARNADGTLPAYHMPPAAALCEECGGSFSDAAARFRDLLRDVATIPRPTLPEDLQAELRDYQLQGVAWLSLLREAGIGAMLADDMGLGKTLQTICVANGRTLVVCPTSVLSSWKEQLQAFRPSLSVSLFHGPDRELDSTSRVVLTTYGVLRLDREVLSSHEWDLVILDEAQTIRNPESQAAQAACSLQPRSRFRIALSGTPIENRLDDLWSQFQFLNPGLLGTRAQFQARFSSDVAQNASILRDTIRPFILRRLKRDVAEELPDRTEVVLHCELSPEERSLYNSILASTRRELLSHLEGGVSLFAALEALLRLRQACCHGALVPGGNTTNSSKLDLLIEKLEDSFSLGHRALVFSQWTSFLDLIEERFESEGISFSRLDGTTRDRGAVVSEFQNEAGPPVMLISLKAGGVGLTLTAADHIFLMDPWWNPAAENQAADRAHRIGQRNPVLIHKMVATDTVEERVLALQRRKSELATALLEGTGSVGELSRDELLSLLE